MSLCSGDVNLDSISVEFYDQDEETECRGAVCM